MVPPVAAGGNDAAGAVQLAEESLSYELLLRKACDAAPASDAAEVASTAEPPSSAVSSAGSLPCRSPGLGSVQLLRNVAPACREMASLVRQSRELSESVFDENCMLEVTKRSGWKLSILASEDSAVLCGFIVSKVVKGSLSISKLAVPADFRGQGFGKRIMDELTKAAKKQGDVFEVCLSSLPEAVRFYERLGFKAIRGLKLEAGEDLVEGQVYMEKRLRRRLS